MQRSLLATQFLNPLFHTSQVSILLFLNNYKQACINIVSLSCIGDLQALLQHLQAHNICTVFTLTHSFFTSSLFLLHMQIALIITHTYMLFLSLWLAQGSSYPHCNRRRKHKSCQYAALYLQHSNQFYFQVHPMLGQPVPLNAALNLWNRTLSTQVQTCILTHFQFSYFHHSHGHILSVHFIIQIMFHSAMHSQHINILFQLNILFHHCLFIMNVIISNY